MPRGPSAAHAELAGSNAPTALQYGLGAGGTELTVGLRAQETAGVRITPRYTFRRAD